VEMARLDPTQLERSRSLYVEFSVPKDADVYDPATWWLHMPAVGYTQTLETIQGFADSMDEPEFRRAFACQWGDDFADADWKIPRAKWAERRDPDSQISETVLWVIDVSPDRSWASIGVASPREDGRIHLEVVDDGPGTDWLIDGDDRPDSDPERLHGIAYLVQKYGGQVWYDHLTAGAFAPDLRDAGIDAHPIGAQDVVVAAPMLLDWVLNDRVRHIGQSELDDALASAATSTFGDGWKWSRGKSMKPITALVTVSLALRKLAELLPELNYDPVAAMREANRPPEEAE